MKTFLEHINESTEVKHLKQMLKGTDERTFKMYDAIHDVLNLKWADDEEYDTDDMKKYLASLKFNSTEIDKILKIW